MDHDDKKSRKKALGARKKMSQTTSQGDGTSPAVETGLTRNLQAHIGRHLRATFDEVAREPLPEKLLKLLRDLEQGGDK